MSGDTSRDWKNRLRKEMLDVRSRLSEAEREAMSRKICDKLIDRPEFKKAGLIMAYMDFRGEAGTAGIIDECYKSGKRVALPKVTGIDGGPAGLEVFETCSGQPFIKNTYGIMEPDPKASHPVEENEIDLVIVPGVAFDLHKYRIGYGAGFYDRFLPKLRCNAVSLGIAYDFQIVDRIPVESHDVPLDFVITEQRILK